MVRYLSANTCKDKPVFIEYLINDEWKNVRYDHPVSVYVEHIGGPGTVFRAYFLRSTYSDAAYINRGKTDIYSGSSMVQAIKSILPTIGGAVTVESIDCLTDDWLEVMRNGLLPKGSPPTITLVFAGFDWTDPSDEQIQAFREEWSRSSPSYAVFVSMRKTFSMAGRVQLVFSQIEETSYIFSGIEDSSYQYYTEVIVPVGSGTAANYEDRGYWTATFDPEEIKRTLRRLMPVGAMHRIQIYSPTVFSTLRRILQFVVPDFPPFDEWIPDTLFDKKELEESSNETIQVKISCECSPGCCKVCCSVFPYFCCVKYRR